MDNIDVLLLNLPTGLWYKEDLGDSNSMPPLGLLYIATYLIQQGYRVKVLDLAVEKVDGVEFNKMLMELNPKIVGMSTYNESWEAERVMCKYVKEALPNVVITAGGAFASFCYEDILNKTETDYITRGEGEYITCMLCDFVIKGKGSIDHIPGLCYKAENGEIIVNTQCNRIEDLDDLPFPDRSLINIEKYLLPYTVCTSRGCPGECIFCSSKAFWGKRVIMRSAENIFDEVMYLHEMHGTNIFYISDDTFTASKKRCLDFCKMIRDSGVGFVWACESRADIVNEEFIKILFESGCHKIQFGFESADNEILRKLKKYVTIEQIENAIKCAAKFGMHIQASYIVGHAFDNEETVEKTIKTAEYFRDTYGARVVCSVNTPFPGTEQYEKREELGIEIKTDKWENFVLNKPIISTKNLTINQLRNYLDQGQRLVL